ncbi:MAG: Gx transporter family protein [Spirochaetaceae bacterium]|jgi:heptaprenyl diphosphate synthase|nr:Gx transporter family protein [Spirochaetaceae bacterium]
MKLTPRSGKKTIALLGGFCLFLATLEYLIPKPLPFMRIGLANAPLLLALDRLSFRHFALLALIKIMGQAIITGTLFSYVFLFSLTGTCASAVFMYLIRRMLGVHRISFIGVSVMGALLSNGTQLALAYCFVFGAGMQYLVPPFLAAGITTSIALGVFCEAFAARSRWYQQA